jgi:hypothetical protein
MPIKLCYIECNAGKLLDLKKQSCIKHLELFFYNSNCKEELHFFEMRAKFGMLTTALEQTCS